MVHQDKMILYMTKDVGEMLSDPKACPKGVTQAEITDFLGSIITEFNSSYQLRNANLNKMYGDIDDYFSGVSDEKDRLVAEQAAEAAAEIVAGAALIASAALSWMPGVNFALSAAAVAAQATALGLEVEAEKLQKTVVEDISNADSHIREKPNFTTVKTYVNAQSFNTKFYPRLEIGTTIMQMRSVFLASVVSCKKRLGREITKTDLKDQFITWHTLTEADPTLLNRYAEIYDLLDKDPEDYEAFKKKADVLIKSYIPVHYRKYGVGKLFTITTSLAIRRGKKFYKHYKNSQEVVEDLDPEMASLKGNGQVAANPAEADEVSMIEVAEACDYAISFLAGVASITFGVLEAVKAKDTEDTVSQAITDAKAAIKKYYRTLVTSRKDHPDL